MADIKAVMLSRIRGTPPADFIAPACHPAPSARADVPTGLAFALPPGIEGQIRPRSGLALRRGVTVLNSPGTIDADYRGEVQVILANLGDEPFTIERGTRIAQLVLATIPRAVIREVASLGETCEVGAFGRPAQEPK